MRRLRPNGRKKDQVGGVSRSDLALLLVLDWSLHSRGGRPHQTLPEKPVNHPTFANSKGAMRTWGG
jgi:hypothetical protein